MHARITKQRLIHMTAAVEAGRSIVVQGCIRLSWTSRLQHAATDSRVHLSARRSHLFDGGEGADAGPAARGPRGRTHQLRMGAAAHDPPEIPHCAHVAGHLHQHVLPAQGAGPRHASYPATPARNIGFDIPVPHLSCVVLYGRSLLCDIAPTAAAAPYPVVLVSQL